MVNIYIIAAIWFLAAFVSAIVANRLKISIALMEIIIGATIGFIAYKTAAIRIKWILFVLLSMGVLAMWSGSKPVLPAYIIGMVIPSAIVPTLIANKFFLQDHLLEKPVLEEQLPDI